MRGRPKKKRNIQKKPFVTQFSPRGHIGRPGYTKLAIDQYEALRLSDFIGLNQHESALSMGISQQTFSRTLRAARKAISEALVLGHIIFIKDQKKSKKHAKKGKVPARNST